MLVAGSRSVADYFHALGELDPAPRYNVAPGQMAPVIRAAREGGVEVALLRWGLVPYWAKDESMAYKLINARSESIADKPAFREAFRRRRCLVPATGFYEWQERAGLKYPHLIELPNDAIFAFAGLWERWRSPQSDEVIETFTIITTAANETVARLHDRMPAILDRADFAAWLDLGNPDAAALLRPYPAELMTLRPVSRRLNNGRVDDSSVLDPDD
jgi:putative SOS response-associated peptidase YedK